MDETGLEDCLPAAQLGQAWALRLLYESLAPQVLGYLRGRGAAEPEDLTSEVFLAVFPKLPVITGGLPGLRTFIFSVAHARLVDDLRARSRRPAPFEYRSDTDERTTRSAEDDALDNLETRRITELLGFLPEDQRTVLLLRVVADLSLEQTSEIMNKSTGAIKQLQRRALIALRVQLGANVTL